MLFICFARADLIYFEANCNSNCSMAPSSYAYSCQIQILVFLSLYKVERKIYLYAVYSNSATCILTESTLYKIL